MSWNNAIPAWMFVDKHTMKPLVLKHTKKTRKGIKRLKKTAKGDKTK